MGGAIGILAIGAAIWAAIELFTAKSEGARRIKWVVVGLFMLWLGAIVVSEGGFGALAVVCSPSPCSRGSCAASLKKAEAHAV